MEKALIIQESAPGFHFSGSLLDGDPEFLAEIVNLFLETCPEMLSAVGDAVSRNDAAALHRAAHTFKGSVANFGAEAIVSQANALELMGKAGDLSRAGATWQVLQNLMLDFIPRLRTELDKITEKQAAK